jgi:deoxyribodipyrimidine photolyase-related protein
MVKTALLLLPNQLFKNHKLIDTDNIFIYLHPKFFTDFNYHKYKLVFHYATIDAYIDEQSKNYNIKKIDENVDNYNFLKSLNKLYIYDPTDITIMKEIISFCKKNNIELVILDTQLFIFTRQELDEYMLSTKKPYFNSTFYKWARHKKDILILNNKPVGGVYSFDVENRLKFPDKYEEERIKLYDNKYIKSAINQVNKKYSKNPGEITSYLPVTRKESYIYFKKFLKNKLKNFGPYEDAIDKDVMIGYHSCCSALINIGLLDPNDLIKLTLDYYKNHKSIKIQSVEAYIRQLISWREFVRLLYIKEYDAFISKNIFKHHNKISKVWYTGETGLPPVDDCIKTALKTSYLHHINRLMVLCNVFLLTETDPWKVYEWFMSLVSIDAYEWVMFPNVFGMGLHSVGTLMMNRPYFSSSNYIMKMSHYSKKDGVIVINKEEHNWTDVWDALYYNFVYNNKDYLKKIYATANAVSIVNKTSKKDLDTKRALAKKYINYL